MVICIKQHLNNIASSIQEKVKQQGWVENNVAYKGACIVSEDVSKQFCTFETN